MLNTNMNELLHAAKWIGTGNKNDKKNSLPPEIFQKEFYVNGQVASAILSISALGIYSAKINGKKVADIYFAPGHGEYRKQVRLHQYDVKNLLTEATSSSLSITVANGWYLGTIGNKNNNYGSVRGLIAELVICYVDGRKEVIGTDETWTYSSEGPIRFADFYCGEIIDLQKEKKLKETFQSVVLMEQIGVVPPILVLGNDCHVRQVDTLIPTKLHMCHTKVIYDFKQNHAGIIELAMNADIGDKIIIRHGEILNTDGSLFTENLRKATQTLTLICGNKGINVFRPEFSFMGFRYAEVEYTDKNGRKKEFDFAVVKFESRVISSDAVRIGKFKCSNELLNKFYSNINWGQLSNFVSIPTDCPQRDERMGWCGDLAVFAETATMNYDICAFMDNWLEELRLAQRDNGTIPVVIPENGTYEPTPFKIPIAIWGDAAVMVPWAVYRAYGDKERLKDSYESMKAYALAEKKVAERFKKDDRRFLWDNNIFQYGDWCAPGEGMFKWKKKGRYLAPMFYANTVHIMEQAAQVLGNEKDYKYFNTLYMNIKDAFAKYCIRKDGTLAGEFQSGYGCALYFNLIPEEMKDVVVKHLVRMVREKEHVVWTGFAGTPYTIFALCDNGYVEDAYKLLLNEKCPGWLYTVKAGGTTVWERWDALNEDGSFRQQRLGNIADMVSFNHYAYGAVGAFLYRRVIGIESLEAGYSKVRISPCITTQLSHAEGGISTPHGEIYVKWEIENEHYHLWIKIPSRVKADIVVMDKRYDLSEGRREDGMVFFEGNICEKSGE